MDPFANPPIVAEGLSPVDGDSVIWSSTLQQWILGASGLPLRLTGATAATRYVGGTNSGAPSTGTFAVGDFVVDRTGIIWVCTVAGSPGTWVDASSSGKIQDRATSTTQVLPSGVTVTDLGVSVTFTVVSRPVEVALLVPYMGHTVAAAGADIRLTDGSNVLIDGTVAGLGGLPANGYGSIRTEAYFSTPGTYTVKGRCSGTADGGFFNVLGLGTIRLTARNA